MRKATTSKLTPFEKYLNQDIPIKRELKQFFNLKDQLTIFDIGACEGEDSIRYANFFPNSKVYAFEPIPKNILTLKENITKYGNGNITIIEEALGNSCGTEVIYQSSGKPENYIEDWDYGNKSSSLLRPDKVNDVFPWLNFDKEIIVKVNTLENICRSLNINSIDFIHLDVQGAEILVLNAAKKYIHKVKMIWLEVEAISLYKDQPLKEDVEEFMKDKGFIKILDTVNNISGDQLYVNSVFFDKSYRKGKSFKSYFSSFIQRIPKRKSFPQLSYSQSGEDLIIKYIFDCRGVKQPSYIDIGAHHPFKFSNTAIFYKAGCRGINIEPDPVLFKAFEKKRRKDINLNLGIGEKIEVLDFYIFHPPTINTFSKEEAENFKSEFGFKLKEVKKVEVESISNILEKFNHKIFPDFLSLDVEGLEIKILRSIDYSFSKPKVICVETISYSEIGAGKKNIEIIDYLKTKNYMVYADTNINTILVDKNFWLI